MTKAKLRADGAGLRIDGRWLVRDLDLEFSTGTLSALVGPNGAGKSTTLGLLAGDLRPTAGRVLVAGGEVTKWKPDDLARARAVMVQDSRHTFAFTVEESVALGRSPWPASNEDIRIVEDSLDATHLADFAARDVTTLSGGEGARAAFSRVLSQTTPILLLDEPTAALDLKYQEAIMRRARAARDQGAIVLAVLHDLNLAARYADRIVMFAAGRVAHDGEPDEVLTAANIHAVYDQPVHVLRHPDSGGPLVVPREGPA